MKMMKGKNHAGRRIHFLAAAALTAALVTGQAVSPALAQSEQAAQETLSVIPENITIDQPVALGDIPLPENEYGTLSWEDPSYVPSQRVESCPAVFTPGEGVDLSWMSGWDVEEGVWRGSVTVVVTSLGETEEQGSDGEAQEDTSQSMNTESGGNPGASAENPEVPGEADKTGKNAEGQTSDAVESSGDGTSTVSAESSADGTGTGELPAGENGSGEGNQGTDGNPSGVTENQSSGGAAEPAGDQNDGGSSQDSSELPDGADSQGTGDASGEGTEDPKNSGSQTVDPESGEQVPAAPDDQNGGETEPEEPDNIFDRTQESTDDRPLTAEDDLTEEEQMARAAENHTCDGIYVSGVNLPWYVQFRATSGETYEFTIEKTANIFKSYEFELWDLKEGSEYEIPEGEYVSVTVPVKEGYEYTVEHILDNGAVETIIPSVEGSVMVFSTHSFSPFGIAGSKPVVGDDITDKNYPGTPTPTPTRKPGTTATPAPSSGNSGGSSTTNKDNAGYVNNGSSGSSGNSGSSSGNSGSGTVDKDNAGYVNDNNSSDENSGNTVSKDNAGYADNSSSSSRAVATGDNTLIWPFMILLAADCMLILAVIAVKRRKTR